MPCSKRSWFTASQGFAGKSGFANMRMHFKNQIWSLSVSDTQAIEVKHDPNTLKTRSSLYRALTETRNPDQLMLKTV
jgi:hypothetical protein